jgi:integrase
MLSPWKNPRSKFFWFRRRIPAEYRKYGSASEIKFSLGTSDWDEAVLRCQEENLKLEREWRANLVGQLPTELSHLQIVALAGEFYAEMVAAHRDEPGRAIDWQQAIDAIDKKRRPFFGSYKSHLFMVFGNEAQAFLRRKNVHLFGDRLKEFILAYVDAKSRAMRQLKRNADSDYTPDEDTAKRFPKFEPPKPEQLLDMLWPEFCAARALSAGTRKKWEPYFESLCKRIKSRDMSRVTEQHLLDWRDSLLVRANKGEIERVSIKFGQMAAAKSFFRWAKQMKRLSADPSVDVHVDVSTKNKEKKRGFTDQEAATILSAALAPVNEYMTAENAAARKWVPWLCAYTGARVNEITQLRACDVLDAEGIACIRITREAGTVKTRKERIVPLHPHLLEMKFREFASSKRGTAPLFYSIARQRNPNRKNPTYTSVGNKLGGWVRGLGIKDPLVAPNHGWRHRFKTAARKVRMNPETRDAIQGHVPRTDGEDYGAHPPDVMFAEIEKLPRYEVVAAEKRDGRRRPTRAGNRNLAA